MGKRKRRNPYIVRKTAGWEYDPEKDKMIQKYTIIGYAPTKAEGLKMLAEFNENPYDAKACRMTFAEVYKAWSDKKYQTVSKSNVHGYTAAYKACPTLYNMEFRDIKTSDLQHCIDHCGKNYPTMKKIKGLFNQLYAYALKNDICNKDYSAFVDLTPYREKNPDRLTNRRRISRQDLDRLWTLRDDHYYQIVLMLIYNGLRISEFLDLKKANVHLEDRYFDVLKSKTENGLRKVPIAEFVLPYYEYWMQDHPESEYLLHNPDGGHFSYTNYKDSYFEPLMDQIGMDYTPHCCRHTCTSLMAEAKIEPTIQKKILGHSGAMTLTERVYTHLDVQILVDEINKLYVPDEIAKQFRTKTE